MQKTNVAHFLFHTYLCNHDRNYQTTYFECSGLRLLHSAASVLKIAMLTMKQSACYVGDKGIVSNSSAMCTSHSNTSVWWLLWVALEASPNMVHIYIWHRRLMRILGFANALFLLECLTLGSDRYSARWFCVTLHVKCRLSSCYWLFAKYVTLLCSSNIQNKGHLATEAY
jgi:hypothetical protein